MPVSWSGQFKVSEIALESFLAVSVPAVACDPSFIGVIEMEIHLSVKNAFEQSFVKLSDDAPLCPISPPEF